MYVSSVVRSFTLALASVWLQCSLRQIGQLGLVLVDGDLALPHGAGVIGTYSPGPGTVLPLHNALIRDGVPTLARSLVRQCLRRPFTGMGYAWITVWAHCGSMVHPVAGEPQACNPPATRLPGRRQWGSAAPPRRSTAQPHSTAQRQATRHAPASNKISKCVRMFLCRNWCFLAGTASCHGDQLYPPRRAQPGELPC